jgi:branched-chain amino acid transport system substrate-binding protein
MKVPKIIIGMTLVLLSFCFTMAMGGMDNALGAENTVTIGVLNPMSGRVSRLEPYSIGAVKLAIKEINEKGGINIKGKSYKLDYVEYDTECRAEVGVAAAERLIEKDKVSFILGGMCSGVTLAVMKVTERAKIPQITAVSTHPKITDPAYRDPYMFRNKDTDKMRIKYISRDMAEDLKLKSVALIGPNDDFGRGRTEAYKKALEGKGIKVLETVLFNPAQEDFLIELQKIKRKDPEALILAVNAPEHCELLVRQARQVGFDKIIGSASCSSVKVAKKLGDAADGFMFELPFYASPKVPHVYQWAKKFKELNGIDPNFVSAPTYDAVYAIAEAIRKAQTTTDYKAIRDAFAQTRIKGVYSYPDFILKFDENGQAEVASGLGMFKGGKIVPITGVYAGK